MNLLGEFGQFLIWIVTGIVGVITEGVRRIHSGMTDLKQENKEQAQDIDEIRQHVGLDENLDGPSRIDTLEREIQEVGNTLDRHETYWTGDPDNPAQTGALGSIYQIRQQLNQMEQYDRERDNRDTPNGDTEES